MAIAEETWSETNQGELEGMKTLLQKILCKMETIDIRLGRMVSAQKYKERGENFGKQSASRNSESASLSQARPTTVGSVVGNFAGAHAAANGFQLPSELISVHERKDQALRVLKSDLIFELNREVKSGNKEERGRSEGVERISEEVDGIETGGGGDIENGSDRKENMEVSMNREEVIDDGEINNDRTTVGQDDGVTADVNGSRQTKKKEDIVIVVKGNESAMVEERMGVGSHDDAVNMEVIELKDNEIENMTVNDSSCNGESMGGASSLAVVGNGIAGTMQGKGFEALYGYSPPIHIPYIYRTTITSDGGEICVTCVNVVVDHCFNQIETGKVYMISWGSLRPAQKKFNHLRNEQEIFMETTSVGQPCVEDDISIPKQQFHFQRISEVEGMDNNSVVNAIRVGYDVSPVTSIMRKNGSETRKRALNLKDESGRGNFCNAAGQELQNICHSEGKVVGTISSSLLLVEPDIPEAQKLRSGFHGEGEDPPTISIFKEVITGERSDDVRKIISLIKEEKRGTFEKLDWITVYATLSYIKVDNFCYTGCSILVNNRKCSKKASKPKGSVSKGLTVSGELPDPSTVVYVILRILDRENGEDGKSSGYDGANSMEERLVKVGYMGILRDLQLQRKRRRASPNLPPEQMAPSDSIVTVGAYGGSASSFLSSFLRSTTAAKSTLFQKAMIGNARSAPKLVIPAPCKGKMKTAMYSLEFYAACTVGGNVSNGLTHMAVTPLDLVKCNTQIDPVKYKGISSEFGVLLKEQGVREFFRGWVPTLLSYSAQGACKFGFYEFFKKYYTDIAGPEYAGARIPTVPLGTRVLLRGGY